MSSKKLKNKDKKLERDFVQLPYEKWIKNESRNNIIRRDVFEGIEASSEADMIKDFKYPIDFNPEKMLDISIQYYIDIKTKYKIMKQKFIKQTEKNYRTRFD